MQKAKVDIDKDKKINRDKENENNKKKRLLIILLCLLLLCVFGVSITYGKGIYVAIENQIIETFKLDKPSSPEINGGGAWAKEHIVKVSKDAYTKNGLAYYEYCVTTKKNDKNCNWVRTDTKNVKITNSGKYYVTFRAVDNSEKRGNVSNRVVAYVDNVNPVIKKINEKEITANNIRIEVEATDEHSGIAEYYYSIDGSNYEKDTTTHTYYNLGANKEYIIYVKVIDKVGNKTIISMPITTKSDGNGDGKCDLNCILFNAN